MARSSAYQTKQKSQLLRFLEENAERHLTAAEVQLALSSSGTPIGAATIYRQLEKLESQGIVRRYLLDDRGGSCWQYIGNAEQAALCRTHFHLKCTVCGQLLHLDCDHLNEIAEHVAAEHNFRIDVSRTIFYGVCAACAEKEETQQ